MSSRKKISYTDLFEATYDESLKTQGLTPEKFSDHGAVVFKLWEDGTALTLNTNLQYMANAAKKVLQAARAYQNSVFFFKDSPNKLGFIGDAYTNLRLALDELVALMKLADIGPDPEDLKYYVGQVKGPTVWVTALQLREAIHKLFPKSLSRRPPRRPIVIDSKYLGALKLTIEGLEEATRQPEERNAIILVPKGKPGANGKNDDLKQFAKEERQANPRITIKEILERWKRRCPTHSIFKCKNQGRGALRKAIYDESVKHQSKG